MAAGQFLLQTLPGNLRCTYIHWFYNLLTGEFGQDAGAPAHAPATSPLTRCRTVQARVLEVGEERDAAAQQAADAEAAIQVARQELEAAVTQRDAQLRQVMEAQQRLAQQLDAAESAEQARCPLPGRVVLSAFKARLLVQTYSFRTGLQCPNTARASACHVSPSAVQ